MQKYVTKRKFEGSINHSFWYMSHTFDVGPIFLVLLRNIERQTSNSMYLCGKENLLFQTLYDWFDIYYRNGWFTSHSLHLYHTFQQVKHIWRNLRKNFLLIRIFIFTGEMYYLNEIGVFGKLYKYKPYCAKDFLQMILSLRSR